MGYNVGDKFIIEINSVCPSLYGIKGTEWYIPESRLDELQRYDPKNDCYFIGYTEGAEAAWETAEKMGNQMTENEIIKTFSLEGFAKQTPYWSVLKQFTPYEAIERIRILEEEKKARKEYSAENKIRIGDVLANRRDKRTKIAVTGISDDGLQVSGISVGKDRVNKLGSVFIERDRVDWEKTDLYFPEIAEFMEKLQEGDTGNNNEN